MAIAKLARMFSLGAVLTMVLALSASAESKARIVRLSDVQGSVQMDRGTGDGFEKAYLNMPIIEGAKLKTGRDGRAEIEFEDGSVMHIVPDSAMVFTHLALGDDGQKLSTIELTDGTAYANVHPKKGDAFTLNFRRESVSLSEPAHFRVEMTNAEATLAVFQGSVEVAGPSGHVAIDKKHSATFDLANNDSYAMAKNFEEDPYDDWDKEQIETHDRLLSSGQDLQAPYSYGLADLNYYGSYVSCPGYGSMWQPYFVNSNWTPFQDGGWVWYPSYGYMWVSAYPWGWMPYRYGSWNYVDSCGGWGWMPGYWNNWYPVPVVVNPPKRTPVPVPPVRTKTTVMVGVGLTTPAPGLPHRIIINPGSASLGVPRGSVRDLHHYSQQSFKNSQPVEVRTIQPPVRFEPRGFPTYGGSGVGAGTGSSGGAPAGSRTSPPPAPVMSAPVSAPPVRSAPGGTTSGTVKH